MTKLRKLKITPEKSDGATIIFSIQGRSTNFPNNKPITINIEQDACYNVLLVCSGKPGNKASVKLEAVHSKFGVYLCTPDGTPSWTGIGKLETEIPNGESASVVTSIISIRRKSDKPSS